MRTFNPIYLLYIIPFGIIGSGIYFMSIVWSELTWYISLIMVSLIVLTFFAICRNILRNFHPKFGIVDERAEILETILNSFSEKKPLNKTELDDIINNANHISRQNLRPAERRMKINTMLQKKLNPKNSNKDF